MKSVKVTYKAGYTSTPEDLKLAVFDLIKYYMKDERKERQTIAGATIENQVSSSVVVWEKQQCLWHARKRMPFKADLATKILNSGRSEYEI
jgi:hypothetical protein